MFRTLHIIIWERENRIAGGFNVHVTGQNDLLFRSNHFSDIYTDRN